MAEQTINEPIKEKAVALATTGEEVPVGTMVKKHKVAIFINTGEQYKRIKKSTTFELQFEANTETFDFIADVNPTELTKNYKISLPQDITMIKGEPDFEFFYEKMYNLPVNPEVKAKVMIVFMFDGDKSLGYKAWETEAQIVYDNLNSVDSKINVNINFGGTIKLGTATALDGTPSFALAE